MIELFASPSPDGLKAVLILEELELPYRVRAPQGPEDPLGRPPTLHDPDGPGGAPISLGEASAIALYLARKARRLGPETAREQAEFDFWAATTARLGFLQVAARLVEPAHALRVAQERDRLLDLLDDRMATRHFMVGERFTVLDALLYPHVHEPAAVAACQNLARFSQRLSARDGVRRGMAALPGAP